MLENFKFKEKICHQIHNFQTKLKKEENEIILNLNCFVASIENLNTISKFDLKISKNITFLYQASEDLTEKSKCLSNLFLNKSGTTCFDSLSKQFNDVFYEIRTKAEVILSHVYKLSKN